MSDNFTFSSAGLTHELELAMQRAGGWTPELVKKMCGGDFMSQVRDVVAGCVKIIPVNHIIDLDADPFVPKGWQGVEFHKKGGKVKAELRGDHLYINDRKMEIYLSERQMGGRVVKGHSLREEVSKRDVLDANVLDYLLAHPQLVAESWKGTRVFFWGTIYRFHDGSLCVRFLFWYGDRCRWSYIWLGDDFCGNSPAAVLASLPEEVAA